MCNTLCEKYDYVVGFSLNLVCIIWEYDLGFSHPKFEQRQRPADKTSEFIKSQDIISSGPEITSAK